MSGFSKSLAARLRVFHLHIRFVVLILLLLFVLVLLLLLQGETAHAVGDLVAFTLGGVQVAAFDDLDPGGGDVEGARVGADMIPAYGTL